MDKSLSILVSIVFLCSSAYGQKSWTLKGTVLDDENLPLIGATVFLSQIEKGTTSDSQGRFAIDNIPVGSYQIEISYIGYQTLEDTVSINNDTKYDVRLSATALSLNEVVITDNYTEARKKEEPLNIEIVNDDYLKQNLGGSLMKSLERLPGVTTIDIGSGQSKPVIRGLGFNRVVVVENSIKHEGQQWGADHGLEIDQYAIDNVEVIKGPASLMYGSDAIGGVIDMKNKRLPAKNTIGGTIDLSGKTNNNFLGTSISMYARRKVFFANFRGTALLYGDYKVPADSVDIYSYRAPLHNNHLRNTAGKEQDLHVSFGIIHPKYQSRFLVSDVSNKSGFFANAHGLEPRNVDTEFHDKSDRDILDPYQQANHFKAINTSLLKWRKYKFESDLGFQRNFRQEWSSYVNHGYMPAVFPDSLSFNPNLERQFEKYIYSGNAKVTYQASDNTQLALGINSDYQDNRIGGRGFIIPAFEQFGAGSYLFAKHSFSERSLAQIGIRYDYGTINTAEYKDWFPSPVASSNDSAVQYLIRSEDLTRHFSNTSWSIGYNYNLPKWSFKANIGKSFRMPMAKELTANGVNYHHFSYEVGNPDLAPEIAYQLDLGIEYSAKKFVIGTTPFLNYFSNYIYLNPSSEHDRLYGNGNQIYYYTESKVMRYGGEIHSHYQLFAPLQLGAMGEYVYSEQLSGEKKGFSLPFSPPASAIFNAKYLKQTLAFLKNAYVSVDYKVVAVQKHIVPPEMTTDGYSVVNVGTGGEIKAKRQRISISLQVQNVLNSKYFNHTSYYRLINVPEPGRNIVLNVSIPFQEKINQK